MSEEKKCFWCGEQIKNIYICLVIDEEIIVEGYYKTLETRHVYFCLKCYFQGIYGKDNYICPHNGDS